MYLFGLLRTWFKSDSGIYYVAYVVIFVCNYVDPTSTSVVRQTVYFVYNEASFSEDHTVKNKEYGIDRTVGKQELRISQLWRSVAYQVHLSLNKTRNYIFAFD